MTKTKLTGNAAYKTNFVSVNIGGEPAGNGLKYGTEYLIVECPKTKYYVAGALFRQTETGDMLVQIDQSIDDPSTVQVENTLRFKLRERDGTPFRRGNYTLKVKQDGTQGWIDEFVIG